mgnify:CR=1 FL=1
MKIYCGLCGQKAHQLFTHVREVHELTPERYRERCPGAPLASEELVRYVQENAVQMTSEGPRKRVEMFGMEMMTDLVPGSMVPDAEEHYLLREDLGRLVAAGLKHGEKLLLVGPTGVGKSTLIEQTAARLNWPVVRVAASGGLTEADLLGEWTVRGGETVFNYGFLPRAMQRGAICLIDEIDGLEPSVAFSLHQLMEDGGRLVLLQNGGEVLDPHPRFRLICTANTLGHGDDSGLYTGTRVLNAAFLDRFASVIRVGHLDQQNEAEVLRRRVTECPEELARKLVGAADAVRQARENDQIFCTLSTRRLIDVARKRFQLGSLVEALKVGLLSRLAPEDRSAVKEILQRHLGDLLQNEREDGDES